MHSAGISILVPCRGARCRMFSQWESIQTSMQTELVGKMLTARWDLTGDLWSWISPFCRALQACQGKLYCLLCYSPGGLSIEICFESCSNWMEFRNCLHVSDHVGVKGSPRLSLENPSVAKRHYRNVLRTTNFMNFRGVGCGWMERWFSAWGLGFLPPACNLQEQKWMLNKWEAYECKNSEHG